LTKLVVQLVSRIPNSEPDTEVIKMQVEAFKKQAEVILKKQPEVELKDRELMEDSSVAKLFEEVKIMFLDLPTRIERNIEPSYRKRKMRLHPQILNEIMFMSEEFDEAYLSFLVIISMFRDDMPWVYEIGKETYEILKSNKALIEKEKAISDFRRLIKTSFRHPFFVEMGGSKESKMMLEDLFFFNENFLDKLLHKKK